MLRIVNRGGGGAGSGPVGAAGIGGRPAPPPALQRWKPAGIRGRSTCAGRRTRGSRWGCARLGRSRRRTRRPGRQASPG